MPDRRNPRKGGRQQSSPQRTAPQGWLTPFPLSKETARFVKRYQKHGDNQNLGLWLDRFTTWRDWDDKGRDSSLEPELTARQRKSAVLSEKGELLHWQGDRQLMEGVTQRWSQMLLSYPHRDAFYAAPVWRFVVGLGRASVLETGMTLHRLYGIPIIPGSALKGLARAYAETVEGKASDNLEVVAVFGRPPRSTPLETGEIIFFDAIPISDPRFKLDVMTPHFQKYYQGNDPPADWQDPNPIYFLTVESTPFLFAVAARREAGKDYVNTALEWLKKGLSELGVGAKTAAGYGYFEEVK
jgi:CRISPR-associated protein Cmr6